MVFNHYADKNGDKSNTQNINQQTSNDETSGRKKDKIPALLTTPNKQTNT